MSGDFMSGDLIVGDFIYKQVKLVTFCPETLCPGTFRRGFELIHFFKHDNFSKGLYYCHMAM